MAWVTYNGPGLSLSVSIRKQAAVRGKQFPCSDPKELEFFKKHPDFSVVEPPKKKAAVAATTEAEREAAPETTPVPLPRRRARRRAARNGDDDG